MNLVEIWNKIRQFLLEIDTEIDISVLLLF